MKADIGTAGLTTGGNRELAAVGGKVADAVHLSCGAVRDDALLQHTLPAGNGAGEPQPRCAQIHVARDRSARETVHTMTHAFEQRIGHEAFDRRRRNSRGELSLLAGEQTPLVLSDDR
jgi:tagatose-1,6-bisphosphate aldolase non-catalytic subunit AgaZ/GatZ